MLCVLLQCAFVRYLLVGAVYKIENEVFNNAFWCRTEGEREGGEGEEFLKNYRNTEIN